MPTVPAATAASAPANLLPTGIEIFRAGRHTDDAGQVHEFSAADVRCMAQANDPGQREVPLCVGHPAHDLPTYGFVKGLSVNAAERLTMDVRPGRAAVCRNGQGGAVQEVLNGTAINEVSAVR